MIHYSPSGRWPGGLLHTVVATVRPNGNGTPLNLLDLHETFAAGQITRHAASLQDGHEHDPVSNA